MTILAAGVHHGSQPVMPITRRTAIASLGSVGLALALDNMPGFVSKPVADQLNTLLPNFRAKSRALLQQLLAAPDYSGRIPASAAASLARFENISVDELMVNLIPLAQSYSHAPVSNFFVGVVVRGASGALYTGANIEIPGQCLGFAVHAEQSALSTCYMHAERAVNALAVGAEPCGHCRQFINEMSPDGEILILMPGKPAAKLSTLLPGAFGPAALGMKNGAFPPPERNFALKNSSGGPESMAALDAARRSYAPYSKSPSGVAIRTRSGRLYRGSYIENVAFNPSLSPLQTALAALLAGGDDYSSIEVAELVEAQAAKITQRPVTETVLSAIAPSAKLTVSVATYQG